MSSLIHLAHLPLQSTQEVDDLERSNKNAQIQKCGYLIGGLIWFVYIVSLLFLFMAYPATTWGEELLHKKKASYLFNPLLIIGVSFKVTSVQIDKPKKHLYRKLESEEVE